MSVLSKSNLLKKLTDNELVISPLLSDEQIGSCSIDLRLGTVAMTVRASGLSHVNPLDYKEIEKDDEHRIEKGRRQKFERHEIPIGSELLLHPGTLTLVPTLEWVKLPTDLQGVVTARSSWAREGLNIATASFINPEYTGTITLELANLGQIPISLFPGMRIAQIAFYNLDKPITQTQKSQFDMTFEPSAGHITSKDEAFIGISK